MVCSASAVIGIMFVSAAASVPWILPRPSSILCFGESARGVRGASWIGALVLDVDPRGNITFTILRLVRLAPA